jgi:hypothetical protein
MLKKFLPVLLLPLLMGCNATFTNLTPRTQVRSTNNLYMVEFALASRQQTLRWETVHPQIVVGNEYYKMQPVRLMTNRWEGLVPVPPSANAIRYRYKAEFQYNAVGTPRNDSLISPEYTLKVVEPSGESR